MYMCTWVCVSGKGRKLAVRELDSNFIGRKCSVLVIGPLRAMLFYTRLEKALRHLKAVCKSNYIPFLTNCYRKSVMLPQFISFLQK